MREKICLNLTWQKAFAVWSHKTKTPIHKYNRRHNFYEPTSVKKKKTLKNFTVDPYMSGHTLPAVWLSLGKQLRMNAAFACVQTVVNISSIVHVALSLMSEWNVYNVFQLDSSVCLNKLSKMCAGKETIALTFLDQWFQAKELCCLITGSFMSLSWTGDTSQTATPKSSVSGARGVVCWLGSVLNCSPY